MRCRNARAHLIGRGSAPLDRATESALRGHLESCPACAAEERFEALLREELGALHDEIPYPLDVRGRVLPRISELGAVAREEVPARQLGWAAALCMACFLGLLAAFRSLLPELLGLAGAAVSTLSPLGAAAADLAAPVWTLIGLPFRLAAIAIESLASLVPLIGRLEPVGLVFVVLSYAAMAATITLVVGRDLRRPQPVPREEER
jgi:hypothetical protein